MNALYISGVKVKRAPEEKYLKSIPAVKWLLDGEHLSLSLPVTFFVGENGTGKSTLIEAIAVAAGFNPEGGTKNFSFQTAKAHSSLHECLTIIKRSYPRDGFFLRAESFFNVATNIDGMDAAPAFSPPVIDSYGGVSLHERSHGESFLALVQNRFSGNGLYILDEPEAALSPMKILTLMCEMKRLTNRNSQFIIATHSPMLMAFPGAEILEFSENGIQKTDFRKTQHYEITRRFLENPEKYLDILFED
ncbi:MAG: ABC transporter ATP-binding protein [Clostridiales bacterium]|nr:ABC transporter ATP-binding protein [Clostridiales bacterium]